MRYWIPLTATMDKLVEACDFVDQLKAQKLRDERLAAIRELDAMNPVYRQILGLAQARMRANAP